MSIEVQLLDIKGKLILKYEDIQLDPYAPTTRRKFTVNRKKVEAEAFDWEYDRITITIFYMNKFCICSQLYEFHVCSQDYKSVADNEWWFTGLLIDDQPIEYVQNVVDILSAWQEEKRIYWWSFPYGAALKRDYIYCCLLYTGLTLHIIEKKFYQIDMAIVREEQDFLFLVAEEFFGYQGYFGDSLSAFKDIFIDICNARGSLEDKKMIFYNVAKITDAAALSLYNDIINIFDYYTFVIEEK